MVRGTVAYRDRSALPPESVVEVWITDVTPGLMMTMALVGEAKVSTNGRQVPIPFEVTYDPSRIAADHKYAVKAAIRSGGEMLYASTQEYAVITGGNTGNVNILVSRSVPDSPAGAGTPLAGTAWRLEDLGGAGVVDRIEATLEFAADGRVSGKGSCNRFFGSSTITGQMITFGALGATRMACTPAVMDQETKYFKALEQAQRFEVQGSTLLITYSGSDKPLRFVKAGA